MQDNHLFKQNHSITLEQMKTFFCVYTSGSFSSASHLLHKTQPAITHSINQLEKKLTTKLIKRTRGKNISFTEEGHNFYQQISPLVEKLFIQLDEIENKNTVSIGLCDDLPIEVQMDIYHKIKLTTNSQVRIYCDFTYKIRQMVSDGRLSFAITKNIVEDHQKEALDYHWVSKCKVDFNSIEKLAVVSSHKGCFLRNLLEQTLLNNNKGFYFSYLANHMDSMIEAINAGFGVGLVDSNRLKECLKQNSELITLSSKQGFPTLPKFQYQCIGNADTFQKRQIKPVLQTAIDSLNNGKIAIRL